MGMWSAFRLCGCDSLISAMRKGVVAAGNLVKLIPTAAWGSSLAPCASAAFRIGAIRDGLHHVILHFGILLTTPDALRTAAVGPDSHLKSCKASGPGL